MSAKTILITGSNTGIGKVTARELARSGAEIILAVRNEAKGLAAKTEIMQASDNRNVHVMTVDLASMASIRRFADEFKSRFSKLDVLVNNAGLFLNKRQVSADGIESTFAVNHLAYCLLSNLLLPALKASGAGRIVNVASEAHRTSKLNWKDLQYEKYSSWGAYNQSKLCNIMFTYALAERLKGSGVTVNCLHPGLVNSEFQRDVPFPINLVFNYFGISVEKGALTSIYLASSPDVEGVSGKYFIKCKEARSNAFSYQKADIERLWELSLKLTNIQSF